MKVRTRLAVLLALALLVVGASVVLVSALTYQQSVYSDPTSLNNELFALRVKVIAFHLSRLR